MGRGRVGAAAAVVVLAVWVVAVAGEGCPNSCSGHGQCGTDNVCGCDADYTGADCSRRSCPSGASWVQKATATDTAHGSMECSNAGLCDYNTGQCQCFAGFDGDACQRTTCPNDCHGRGKCITMKQMATEYGLDTDAGTIGDGVGPSYTAWDAEVQYGCVCDYGYTGPDCARRYCPYTDDPDTTGQYDRTISFTTDNTVDAAITGYFYIWFMGQRSSAISADADTATSSVCQEAFEAMDVIKSARCFRGTVSGTNKRVATYTVALEFAEYGMNNLFHFEQSALIKDFTCDGSEATTSSGTISCSLTDVDTSMAVSGNNNPGGAQTILLEIDDATSDPNTFKWNVDGGSYTTGVAIPVGLSVTLQNAVVVTFQTRTGHTVGAAWSITVTDSTAALFSSPTQREHEPCGGRGTCDESTGICSCYRLFEGLGCSLNAFFLAETDDPKLHLVDLDTDFTGNMLIIETERSESADFNMILAKSQNTVVFRVTGEGKVTMNDATASGAVTADSFVSSTGATVVAGGLIVDSGGVTVTAGPLRVLDGGATIVTAATNTPALTLTSTSSSFTDNVLRVATDTAAATTFNLIQASANGAVQFTVDGTGGVSTAGGVTIVAGGLTVTGGGLVSDTGVTVSDGGLQVVESSATAPAVAVSATNGAFADTVITGKTTRAADAAFNMMKLQANGVDLFTVSGVGKTTVHQSGMEVDAGGVTIDAGGLKVTGGHTITSGGLDVSGGVTVTTGGMSILDDGLTIVETDSDAAVLDLSASSSLFLNSVLRVTATRSASTAFDYLTINDNTSPVFRVRGDGKVFVTGDMDIGDSTADRITVNGYVQGAQPLIFEGATDNAHQAIFAITDPTATRTIRFPDASGDVILAPSTLPDDRIVLTNNDQLTTDANMVYDGTDLSMTGPSAVSIRATSGSLVLSAATTMSIEANSGDLTLSSASGAVSLAAAHASTGDLALTAAATFTSTSTGTTTVATDDGTSTSALTIKTGKASAGASGDLTLSTGASTNGAAGAFLVAVGATNNDPGSVSILAGDTTGAGQTGGDIVIVAGGATGGTGGAVSLVAGDGSSVGGDVVVQPGKGSTTHGAVLFKEGDGNTRMQIAANGAISLSTDQTISMTSAGALSVTTGSTLSVTAAADIALTSTNGDLTVRSEGHMVLSTNDASGAPGDISIMAGDSTATNNGADIVMAAGGATTDNKDGGYVAITAGAAAGTGSTGGHVSIVSGGAVTGGDIVLRPGTGGTTHGAVRLQDNGGVNRISLEPDGDISLSSADQITASATNAVTVRSAASTMLLAAAGAMTFSTQTAAMSLVAGGAMVMETLDAGTAGDLTFQAGTSTTGAGAYMLFEAGDASANSATGGSVSIVAGAATGGGATGGSVYVQPGNGATDGTLKLVSADTTEVVTITSAGDVDLTASTLDIATTNGDVTIVTADATAAASGSITLSTGKATNGASGSIVLSVGDTSGSGAGAPGDVSISAGDTTVASTNGGAVHVLAGATTSAAGGHVSVLGGAGSTAGGNVVLRPGTGSTNGMVVLESSDGTDRVVVRENGAVSIAAPTLDLSSAATLGLTAASTMYFSSGSNMKVESTGGELELSGGSALTIKTYSVTSGSAGAITLSAGATTAASAGANVEVLGGSSGAAGGDVVVAGGASSGGGDTGGSVSVVGGTGNTGGDVIIKQGHGTSTAGVVELRDHANVARVQLDASGNLKLTSAAAVSVVGADIALSATASTSIISAAQVSIISESSDIHLVAQDGITLRSDGTAGNGDVRLLAGAATAGTGPYVLVRGGATSGAGATGGDVSISGGASSGTGATVGGNVVMRPGDGATDGAVVLEDAGGTARLTVASAGEVSITATTTVIQTDDTSSATASGALTVQTGQATSAASGALTLASGDAGAGTAGTVTLSVGASSGSGSTLTIAGGATTSDGQTGGLVSIVGGASGGTGGVGGTVSVLGGAGKATGGSVVVRPGAATADGVVRLNDGNGVTRLLVDATGDLSVTVPELLMSSTGTMTVSVDDTLSLSSTNALQLTSNAAVSLLAGSHIKLSTDSGSASPGSISILAGASTTGAAGDIVLLAGSTTSSGGGEVSIIAGSSTGGAGGSVRLKPGAGSTNGVVKLQSAGGEDIVEVQADGGLSVASTTTTVVQSKDLGSGTTGAVSIMSGDASSGASGDVVVASGTSSGTASGTVTISVGSSNVNNNPLSIIGGATSGASHTAGDVVVEGGTGTGAGSTGGTVSILGGTGAGTGGNVVFIPGNDVSGSDHGAIDLKDAGGTTRFKIANNGVVTLSSATTGSVVAASTLVLTSADTLSVVATNAATLTSTSAAVSVLGQTGTTVTSTSASGTPGTVSIIGGTSTSSTGGLLLLQGGAGASGQTGGAVSIQGGTGAGATGVGGMVSILGGPGTSTGGGVVVRGGSGSTPGALRLQDPSGNDCVHVSGTGVLSMSSISTTSIVASSALSLSAPTISFAAGTTMSLSSAGVLTLEGNTGTVLQSADATGASAGAVSVLPGSSTSNGGDMLVTGGQTSGSGRTGGYVKVQGGAATASGSTGGSISVLGGTGTSTGGDVVLRPGRGSTTANNGAVVLQDGDGTARVTVSNTGVLTLAGDTTSITKQVEFDASVVFGGIVTQAATSAFNVASTTNLLIITASGGSNTNTITVTGTTPTDGQFMLVVNQDDEDTAGDIVVSPSSVEVAVYYSGTWYTQSST